MKKSGYTFTYSDDKSELISVEFDEWFDGQKLCVKPGTKIIKKDAITFLNDLETIILPDSLEIIEDGAICDCESIKSIVIPKNVRSIGENFLHGCESLEKINVDRGNHNFTVQNGILWSSNFTEIIMMPSQVQIEKFEIPDTVYSIRTWAFGHNKFLKEIAFPKNIKKIPVSVCAACSNLKKVILPEGLEVIDDYAFWGCERLHTINFPAKLQEIGVGAFSGCSFTQIQLPASLKSIKENAFYGCEILKSFHIPRGVEDLDVSALLYVPLENISLDSHNKSFSTKQGVLFSSDGKSLLLYPSNASKLHYSIPEGTEDIGYYAFNCCKNLLSIHIPTSLKKFSVPYNYEISSSIYKCDRLEKIFVDGKNLFFAELDNILFSKNLQTLLCYPDGKKPINGIIHIPDGVKDAQLCLLLNNQNLKEVTCPKSLLPNLKVPPFCDFKITIRKTTCSYDIHEISDAEMLKKAKNDSLELTCVIFPDRGIEPIHTEVSEDIVIVWMDNLGPICYVHIDLIRDYVNNIIECGNFLDFHYHISPEYYSKPWYLGRNGDNFIVPDKETLKNL